MRDLPSGTVTFLFTGVEGSTKLLDELGVDDYAKALAEHRRTLREAFSARGGVEVDTQGDAFFFAFPTAPGALAAAAAALEGLSTSPIRVRMGVHTGTPHVGEEGYVGVDPPIDDLRLRDAHVPKPLLRSSPLDSGAASLHDRVRWCAISRPA